MEPLWPMPKDDDDLLHKSVRFETSRAKLEEYSSLSCSFCNLLLSKSNDFFLYKFVTVNVSLSLSKPRGQQFYLAFEHPTYGFTGFHVDLYSTQGENKLSFDVTLLAAICDDDIDDPAAKFMHENAIKPDFCTPAMHEQIEQWMDVCFNHHNRCVKVGSSNMPTRLLHILEEGEPL